MNKDSYLAKEKLIQEKRTIEATRKNFIGLTGKFGAIVQTLGHKIISSGFFEEAEEISEDIPTFEDDYEGVCIGYHFDGLSRGLHLEIQYDQSLSEIKVHYKGSLVYHEVAGDLFAYVPQDVWENEIEKLYKSAKLKVKNTKQELEGQRSWKAKIKAANFLDHLKDRWGI